jgi:integrase
MPPRYRLLVQLAAFCALRFGELTELRRTDIDTQRGVIMVRPHRTWSQWAAVRIPQGPDPAPASVCADPGVLPGPEGRR